MSTKAKEWIGRWNGQTVACLASGPSLTPEDVALIRATGWPTIVTNTTFRMAPWADVLFAFDGQWWRTHGVEAKRDFAGKKVTMSPAGPSLGVESFHNERWFEHWANSGAAAIALAVHGGAKRIVLLGYDCQKTGGKAHWHGDHPAGLTNTKSLPNWPRQFKRTAKMASGKSEVLNCSRATALDCFPRAELESLLTVETLC